MALDIERILDARFEFSLDGGDPISDNAPNMTTFGDVCHFKTKNGANLIANQNVTYDQITVIDTYGGTGNFTFANVQNLWTKLIELNFFAGVGGGGGGGGVTRFDALLDGFTYFGNDGKVPMVNESELKLEPVTFYNFNEFIQMDDVAIETLIVGKIVGVALVEGVPKIVLTDPIEESDQFVSAVGGFYYADLATQTTPLAYTTGDLQIENDIDGADTFLTQPPYGITSVWDEGSNVFSFSQLSIGDEIFLRIDLIVTTSAANQTSNVKLLLGEGTADEKTLVLNTFYTETAAATVFTSKVHFDIRNENQRITGAKLLFDSDASADIEVTGFHVYIVRKSVNILDITDNDFKTFSVAQLASPTVDVSTNTGTVKIGYEGVGNKVTNILFGLEFSKYLIGVDALLTTKSIEIGIYNKTKKLFLSAKITSFTEPSTGYYNAVLAEVIDIANVAVNDSLQIDFSLSDIGTGTGDVVGPASATDNAVARYDGTTGKLLQDSGVTVSDTGAMAGVTTLNANQVRWSKGADVASASALPILTDGNYFDVTGNITITSINTTGKVGTPIKLHFDGILTLTHHATDLVLPTGANITTQAGDEVEFLEYAAGDFRCTSYLRADGTALVGSGVGDMTKAVYDPNTVEADAFDMDNFTTPTVAKTTPVDADTMTIWDSAVSFISKYVTWANIKATLKTYFDTLYVVVADFLEEKIYGTATYNATVTGATNLSLTAAACSRLILTGNATITFTDTPASGKSVVRTYLISSTAAETLGFANSTNEYGTYVNDTSINKVVVEASNYPTAGLIIDVQFNVAN